MPKPGDFFVGIIDLLSILVPGMVVSGTIIIFYGDLAYKIEYYSQSLSLSNWVFVIIFSYLLGHILFHISAFLDLFYDAIKDSGEKVISKETMEYNNNIKRLSWVCAFIFVHSDLKGKNNIRKSINKSIIFDIEIENIRKKYLDKYDSELIKNYKFCMSYLRLNSPRCAIQVDRFEAHQKFFRSITVLLIIIALILFLNLQWKTASFVLILSPLVFLRYVELRRKTVTWAYNFVLVALSSQDNNVCSEDEG